MHSAQLEQRLSEMANTVQAGEQRIKALEQDKQELRTDLDKIVGNLNRW